MSSDRKVSHRSGQKATRVVTIVAERNSFSQCLFGRGRIASSVSPISASGPMLMSSRVNSD
jgi:hypothetical protein